MSEKEICTIEHKVNELVTASTESRFFASQVLSESTKKFYRIDFRIFSDYCKSLGIEPIPSSPENIANFLSMEASYGIKPATLVRRLAAIKMAHEVLSLPNPTQHKIVRSVLKGIKRTMGTAPNKKAPITADRLESIISHCDKTLIGLRDKVLLLLGFAGAFRRSELVALTINDIERTPEGIKVIIRKSKGDQEGKGQTIAILNGTRFRVVEWLNKWCYEADINQGVIFRSIRKGNKVQEKALSSRSVSNIIKRYTGMCGLNIDNFSGHSLRSGFITSGAQAGADIFKLMEVSRHKKPETVLEYVRDSKLFENHAGEKFL
jgi:integrase